MPASVARLREPGEQGQERPEWDVGLVLILAPGVQGLGGAVGSGEVEHRVEVGVHRLAQRGVREAFREQQQGRAADVRGVVGAALGVHPVHVDVDALAQPLPRPLDRSRGVGTVQQLRGSDQGAGELPAVVRGVDAAGDQCRDGAAQDLLEAGAEPGADRADHPGRRHRRRAPEERCGRRDVGDREGRVGRGREVVARCEQPAGHLEVLQTLQPAGGAGSVVGARLAGEPDDDGRLDRAHPAPVAGQRRVGRHRAIREEVGVEHSASRADELSRAGGAGRRGHRTPAHDFSPAPMSQLVMYRWNIR